MIRERAHSLADQADSVDAEKPDADWRDLARYERKSVLGHGACLFLDLLVDLGASLDEDEMEELVGVRRAGHPDEDPEDLL